jgi:hypothetical protein
MISMRLYDMWCLPNGIASPSGQAHGRLPSSWTHEASASAEQTLGGRFQLILLMFITIGLCACETKLERVNYSKDVESGEIFISEFYTLILENKKEDAARLFSTQLGYEESVKALEKVEALYGKMLSVEDMEIYTNTRTFGDDCKGEYVITSTVQYEREKCKETVTVTLIKSKPYITGYKTNVIIQ